jgi:hypothetical protein
VFSFSNTKKEKKEQKQRGKKRILCLLSLVSFPKQEVELCKARGVSSLFHPVSVVQSMDQNQCRTTMTNLASGFLPMSGRPFSQVLSFHASLQQHRFRVRQKRRTEEDEALFSVKIGISPHRQAACRPRILAREKARLLKKASLLCAEEQTN